ncbi:hypothetical protein EV361DRAFT_184028 [Lentinula raphanica]|nr:hypothetical protein EV361DRAFT_184028 [Lentinula raphanica]
MRLSAAYLTIVIFRLFPTASSVPVLGAAGGQTFSIPTYSNFRKPGQETSPNEQAGNTVTNLSAQGSSPNEQSVNPVSNPFAQRPSPSEQTGNPVLVSPSTQGPSHKKQTVSASARPVSGNLMLWYSDVLINTSLPFLTAAPISILASNDMHPMGDLAKSPKVPM